MTGAKKSTRAKKSRSLSEFNEADAFRCLMILRSVGWDDQYLDQAKQRFERGDKSALADALYACVLHHSARPLPEWVAQAIAVAFPQLKVTWDDVFGPPHRKYMHVEQNQVGFNAHGPEVWVRVTKLTENEKISRRKAFSLVGNQLGMDAKTAEKYFYAANKQVRLDPTLVLDQLEKFAAGMRRLRTLQNS